MFQKRYTNILKWWNILRCFEIESNCHNNRLRDIADSQCYTSIAHNIVCPAIYYVEFRYFDLGAMVVY